MEKRAVVSFANTPFYQEKMKRLQDSVEAQGIKFIGYKSFEEVGCKPHSEVPYAFKPYAIQKAIESGVTTVLWCDSPVVAIGDLTPVFEYIENNNVMFFENIGHELGKWSTDKALKHYGKTREQAMNIKQTMQCCFGLNFKAQIARDFFSEYIGVSDELYPGPWETSRHDQMCSSFIIDKMGIDELGGMLKGHETFFIYTHFRNVFTISKSVCLESQ